jgi:hypothetical protein
MRKFELYRNEFDYTLEINNIKMIQRRFNSEIEAIDWFLNYISSFRPSTLNVNFNLQEDRT